jgi:hypothetical protein
MSDAELNEILGRFWGAIIKSFVVDVCNQRIIFSLEIHHINQEVEWHEVVFLGVSSYFFVYGKGPARFPHGSWDNAEFTEIHITNPPGHHIQHMSDKKSAPQYQADYNVYIEVWSAVLMIEATAITIDGDINDIA